MKKLINDPRSVVRESLEGLVDLDPRLALLADENIVVRADLPALSERQVALISGGGSGHEPAHAGYVGPGLLTAAVAGDVFTSPSVDAILAAILAVAGPAGALLIVKNYTGDRLNFGLAAELARAEGIPVEIVVVADDAALRDLVPAERRRGLAGTVLVHKVAGAAAAEGRPLTEVARVARGVAADVRTMGIALGSCTVPAAGRPSFELGEDEIEFGLGIHGEKGVRRATIASADAIVDEILATLLLEVPDQKDTPLALLANGLGGTAPMELSIVARRALQVLRSAGRRVDYAWTGEFMTALEMPGCSISLLPLDEERSALLEAPAEVAAWPGSRRLGPERRLVAAPEGQTEPAAEPGGATPTSLNLRRIVDAVAEAMIAAEVELTDLDSKAGDGDLGASMERGARALKSLPDAAFSAPQALLHHAANSLRRAIAGSSGPFYATGIMRASQTIAAQDGADEVAWNAAFRSALDAVGEIGGAKPGDRTMLDALAPAADAWDQALRDGQSKVAALRAAALAAREGAAATARMSPRLGRASYLGERALGVPDGGAVAVSIWLQAIAEAMGDNGAAERPAS